MPLHRDDSGLFVTQTPTRAQLESLLHKFLPWHKSLLHELATRQQDPKMVEQRQLSDLNEKEWQWQRRQRHLEAKRRMQQSRELARQRDAGERAWWQMSYDEQDILSDYRSGISIQAYQQTCIRKPKFMCG